MVFTRRNMLKYIAAAVEKTKFRLHETVECGRKMELLRASKIYLPT